jgi:streptomycin 6-kinase
LLTQWDQLLEMERSERDPLLKEMAEQGREHAETQLNLRDAQMLEMRCDYLQQGTSL